MYYPNVEFSNEIQLEWPFWYQLLIQNFPGLLYLYFIKNKEEISSTKTFSSAVKSYEEGPFCYRVLILCIDNDDWQNCRCFLPAHWAEREPKIKTHDIHWLKTFNNCISKYSIHENLNISTFHCLNIWISENSVVINIQSEY